MKKEGRFYCIACRTSGPKPDCAICGAPGLPSVTTILSAIAKPALINWASYGARDATIAAARAIYEAATNDISPASFEAALRKHLGKRPAHLGASDAALNVGTLVHARIEGEIKRELGQDVPLIELPEEELVDGKAQPHPAWNAYQSYRRWRKEHAVRPVASEQRVFHQELGFAGTADLVAYVADRLTVADFKTSKAVYGEYRLQIGAYRQAYLRNADVEYGPLGGLILRFPKERGDDFEAADVAWADQNELMGVFLAVKRVWEWMS